MKIQSVSFLRAAALVPALLVLSSFAAAADAPDHTADLLATYGTVPVKAAGPYVEIGTYRIQVRVRLGRPYAMLPDGAYLYKNFTADDSDATGTLVIRFDHGRVSQMSLVTPAVATALLKAPPDRSNKAMVAAK